MNIIRKVENARQLAKLTQEMEEKLSRIPKSHLNGIEALPLELWSQIIEHVLDPYLQRMKRQCWDLPMVLELRLVCHAFDREIQRALHQRLTLSQIPYQSFLIYGIQKQSGLSASLRDSLLASALYHETQGCSGDGAAHAMTHRIRNCVLVAQHLSSDHNMQAEQTLYKKICIVASASRCCWNYIFILRYNSHAFVDDVDYDGNPPRHRDILLEVSLLVATGYQLADVRRWMVRLGRLGMLAGYREHAVKRPKRRWGDAGYRNAQVHVQYEHSAEWDQWAWEEIGDGIRADKEALDRAVDEEFEDLERRFNV